MQVTTTRAWATGKQGSPGLCQVWQVAVSGAVGALFWTVSDGRVPGGTAVPGDTRRSAGLYDLKIGCLLYTSPSPRD